jgi:hypothetical protein
MTKINEEINISGSAEELLQLMKLAGADNAKAVDAGDISSHTHAEPETGSCGSSPEMDMGDYIRMVSTEEEEVDGEFQDASTEPDEEYMNDVSASIPAGNDLNRKKGSHPPTNGADNPMALEDKLRAELKGVLAEKMAALQEHEDEPEWMRMFMPGVANALRGHPDFRTMSSDKMRLPGTSGNKPGKFYKPDELAMPDPELDNPLARMISKLYAAGEITHDEYQDSMEKIQSYTGDPEDFQWSGHPKESQNEQGKEQGADGKACWDGYRFAGTEDGKDKCVPTGK